MKAAIKGLLRAVGLAPARETERLTGQARHATDRVAELEAKVAGLRADVESWKHHYEESASAVAEWKHAASAAGTKAEGAEAEARRAEARAEELNARSEKLAAQVRAFRDRLDEATIVTAAAREHLMATEVKLDLIEAAIQVLDTRTREGAMSRT